MQPIQMVDLKQQYAKIKTEVDTAMQEVISSAVPRNRPAVGRMRACLMRQKLKVSMA